MIDPRIYALSLSFQSSSSFHNHLLARAENNPTKQMISTKKKDICITEIAPILYKTFRPGLIVSEYQQ